MMTTQEDIYFARDCEDLADYVKEMTAQGVKLFVNWTNNSARTIGHIEQEPTPQYESDEITVGIGAYRTPDGTIYVVKPNKAGTRVYAKRLVEAPSSRMTELGEIVDFDFVYEPGAIYHLTPQMQMTVDEAKKLMIRYGRCIICGRRLKVAESVERGIGPKCFKYFRQNNLEEGWNSSSPEFEARGGE